MPATSVATPNPPSLRAVAAAMLLALAAAGCGQKGPLMLPPAAGAASTPSR